MQSVDARTPNSSTLVRNTTIPTQTRNTSYEKQYFDELKENPHEELDSELCLSIGSDLKSNLKVYQQQQTQGLPDKMTG